MTTDIQNLLVLDFESIGLDDTPKVGGKNSSLGELYRVFKPQGINALDGFATTADAFRQFLAGDLSNRLRQTLATIAPGDLRSLADAGDRARKMVMDASLPPELEEEIVRAYRRLTWRLGAEVSLAVRSSATAEDLPGASFAGQHSSFLNVQGATALLDAVHRCFASLFTDRAIDYRNRNGFDHFAVALSVGVQRMVHSSDASSGVIFTLDPDTGFRDAIVVSGAYGLGESIVQGTVQPDEWTVFKPTLLVERDAIVGRKIGSKATKIVSDGRNGVATLDVPEQARRRACLNDVEVAKLARWALAVEQHYSKRLGHHQPMDIEWAKDGPSGELFILQARPETVHSFAPRQTHRTYRLTGKTPNPLVTGQAVGAMIASGPVRVVREASDLGLVQPGDVLVAKSTDPDWEPVLKKVAAIITDEGGRTAHAAIVSREIGVPCIVGTGNGTQALAAVENATVSCAEGSQGRVYAGKIPFELDETDFATLPSTETHVMLNVGDPAKAFRDAMLPSAGVGLARMEFIVNSAIGIHPMALCHYPSIEEVSRRAIEERIGSEDPREFFVRRLSLGIAGIAAAFYPRPVIVRMSDFKTNEYASLLGGNGFEPEEENPMLGFRGASRYADPRYAEAFVLECRALSHVREEMGLVNVKAMIPFCRTPEEGRRVLDFMAEHGLRRGETGLQILCMCEIPSNVLEAEEFLTVFDGFSIGSNDLTQLTLGIDRDSGTVSQLFDERSPSVKRLIGEVIETAHRIGKPVGICGQAPSDYPDFAAWLVERGIDSISVTSDALAATVRAVAGAESHRRSDPTQASKDYNAELHPAFG